MTENKCLAKGYFIEDEMSTHIQTAAHPSPEEKRKCEFEQNDDVKKKNSPVASPILRIETHKFASMH